MNTTIIIISIIVIIIVTLIIISSSCIGVLFQLNSKTQINDFDLKFFINHNILYLKIPMDNIMLMTILNALHNLFEYLFTNWFR